MGQILQRLDGRGGQHAPQLPLAVLHAVRGDEGQRLVERAPLLPVYEPQRRAVLRDGAHGGRPGDAPLLHQGRGQGVERAGGQVLAAAAEAGAVAQRAVALQLKRIA